MRRIWRDYSLGVVLFGLFAVSWAVQTWTGWREFVSEQRTNGEAAHWLGPDGYIWAWAQATFENWQSEFLQLFAMVALTSFLLFKGSPESRDSDDETKAMLEHIQRQLDALTAGQPAGTHQGETRRAA
jgi:hypothetical protein